jgi:hypothetical protein
MFTKKDKLVFLRVVDKDYDLSAEEFVARDKSDMQRYEVICAILAISDWDIDKKARTIMSVLPLLGGYGLHGLKYWQEP